MIFKFVFFSCVIAQGFTSPSKFTNSLEVQPYVVNGTNATVGEFPFMVSLQLVVTETVSYHACGGTILSQSWILTVRRIQNEEPRKC